MVLALAELIAAWNCWLQSEKSMLAAGWLEDELAEAESLAELPAPADVAEFAVLAGGSAWSVEVHAAVTSSAAPATSTDRRVTGRVAGTC
jgi:hypothetical protein